MTPRVSFVIPAYNAQKWVSKAIYSCRNQTIKQFEIVVVNDGSTDWTKDILDWHAEADKRIRVFHLPQNMGRSFARNFGNDKAESDLILVLDSDDMATRNRAKDTIAAFELKKADLIYGSFFVVDSIGSVERKIPCQAFDPALCRERKMNFICHSTMAYRKKLAQDVRYDEGDFSRLGLDDWKFQWEAHKKGYVLKHLRTPLAYYRVTEEGISQTRDQAEVDKLKEAYLGA